MQLLVYISNYIVPFLILSIIVYGLSAKVNVYETFIKGAKSGFFTVVRIMPALTQNRQRSNYGEIYGGRRNTPRFRVP